MGPNSGDPVDAKVRVLKCVKDATQSFGNATVQLGDSAGIDVDGIAIPLISIRTQALGRELFTNVGIDPAQRKIVVVKSTNHFYGAFGPIAKEVLYSDGPGALPRDFGKIPYKKVRRPIWPLDPDALSKAALVA
jgi:microcystin degradation protein MlrC